MERDSYHHGDLKNSLLELAIKKIEEVGVEKLSIRELAREIGTSKSAPYRHFKNREDLVAAIANFGFNKLSEMMKEGIERSEHIKDSIINVCYNYLEFSKKHPAIYNIMFKVANTKSFSPKYDKSSEECFLVLFNLIEEAITQGEIRIKDPMSASLSIWSYIHGCTSFIIEGILPPVEIDPKTYFNSDFLFKGL